MTIEELQKVAELYCEGRNVAWSLGRMKSNDERWNTRLGNQVKRFDKRSRAILGALGLECIDFINQAYSPEIPVMPLNLDEFQPDDKLFVDFTKQPVIKLKDSTEIIKEGIVILAKRKEG